MSSIFAKLPICEVASVERGKFSARPRNDPRYYGGEIPFLQTGDIARAGRFIVGWEQTLNAQGLAVSRLFHRGTIFMSIAANVGDVAISTFDAACPDSVVGVIPKNGNDAGWLFQILSYSKDRLSSLATQNAQANLSLEKITPFAIPVPSLPEQRKIAEILRTWDEAIEKLEALRAAKSSRASGVAQILLAPSRAIGRHIPRTNWVPTVFAEAFEERQDRNDNLGPDDVVTVGKYAIRKQSEHFMRSVASSDLSNYRVISPGDFVYDPMSAYYGAIGRYQGTQDGIVSPAYRVIRLRADIVPEFMVALLRSYPIRFQLDRKSSQGNKEGKRRIIQRDEFGSIEFNLPVLDIQRHIASVLVDFERDIALATDQLDALRRQKRGLMQKLLTGEWRVHP
ncbi:MAG: restriction endonuclease subunit S [Roseomonas sp.]|nr:restriction endonuclease subunit S [Roseomonas sp.]